MNETTENKVNRILLVTTSNFPYGGASANMLRLLTTGLVKNKRKVEVLLQKGIYFGNITEVNKRKDSIEGVPYAYCGYLLRPNNFFKRIVDSAAGMIIPLVILIGKRIKNEIDCVVLYNSTAYECLPLFVICKALRIPIINHVVEWYEKDSVVTKWWKLPKWWDFLFRMKVLNVYFDGLIVTSSFLKNYYLKRNCVEDRILILPNLVDISNFISAAVRDFGENKLIRIGYCGTPTQKDGIDDLLSAFEKILKKHPACELLVIGDTTGRKSLIPALEEKCKQLGIFEKVVFTGLVKWEEIPGLLNSCDILVLARPSGKFAEAGFPTKLGEYMACKKPVIVTRVGDMASYLKDGQNAMLAEPDNPESVSSKISSLIEDSVQAKKIGENGYAWVEHHLEFIGATNKVGNFFDTFKK